MDEEKLYKEFRKWHPKAHFTFPEIEPADGLRFEKLTIQNFEQLYLLFKDDGSPYVDERFKTYDGAKSYAAHLYHCGAYSPKHGGQDWLFSTGNEGYAGILHLYDLSLETFADHHKQAWIGFAIKQSLRRQGITSKALRHFIQSIFGYYTVIDLIHAMTAKENETTKRFLLQNGFTYDPRERHSKAHDFYLLTRPGVEMPDLKK